MSVFDNVKGQNKYLENLDRKDPRPSTNTTSMYEKSTTHVNRTYSQTYWFMYIDSRADILYYYTQPVLMKCTSVYTTHINGIHTHTHGHCTLYM